MTTREDVTVDFEPSPRIAEVADPSTEITMQDVVDTLRKREDVFSDGMANTKLMNASGKENLGGGVLVGITVALQDTQVSFEARTTPAETGTVTTGSSTPISNSITFEDTAADFSAASVVRGSLVINFTDQSVADVVEVINSTTLRTKLLVNGIGNTFDSADVYQVFNIIQCSLDGGNLVAVDEFDSLISPVLPTAFTQIVRTSASSATIAEQTDIQFASFNGEVTVDILNGTAGTTFPTGTPRQPSDNFIDALSIANSRGFTKFKIIGDATIDAGQDYSGFDIIGESQAKSTLTISAAANVTDSQFGFATILGTLDGANTLHNCQIGNLTFLDGFITSCILNSTITLSGSGIAHFLDCFSGIPGASTPIIDFDGNNVGLSIRGYVGGITLRNKTGSASSSIDMNSGQIVIEDSVTSGIIILRGTATWTNKDTYVGGASITDNFLNNVSIIEELNSTLYDTVRFDTIISRLQSMATGRIVETSTGVFDFYEQDNSTVLFTLTKAGSERNRS